MARTGRPPGGAVAISRMPMYLELWNRAVASPRGIRIKPGPGMTAHNFTGQLYNARRECGHTAYNGHKVVEDAEGFVWIMPR